MVAEEVAVVEPSHPSWPKDGDHLFTEWEIYSKTELYRRCVHPKCKHWEKKPVPKG